MGGDPTNWAVVRERQNGPASLEGADELKKHFS